jgi:hypothetical protein
VVEFKARARGVGGRAARVRQFVEVVAVAPRADGVIEIVVREQVRIRVSGAFDAAMLRRVVTALEGR